MVAIVLTLICSIVLPIFLSVYGFVKRQSIPIILGAIAFTVSQVVIRIPLLQFLSQNSSNYSLFQVTYPIVFLAVIALSAGVFEETARWIAMRLFMKQRDGKAAIYFGIGHGGIEAILIVGLPVLLQLSVALITTSELITYLGAFERIIAITLHICFSIIVFYSVKKQKLLYYLLAIFLHGLTNFTVVLISSQINPVVAELAFLAITAIMILFSIRLMKGMYRDEKNINGIN